MEMSTKRNIIHKDYEVLELKPGASLINIKKAYKKLVKKWHPDLFPSHRPKAQEKAHQMFRQISDAYTRLIKIHQEYSNKSYSVSQKEPSSHEFYPEPSDWEKDETSPSQTIEMVDRKWPDGTRYEGMSLNGKFHGRGIYTYPNGDIYSGEFQFGKIQGQGQFNFKNGDKYVGAVCDNQMHGQGKMTLATGGHYVGHFANNHFHGEGVLATPEKVLTGRWNCGIFTD